MGANLFFFHENFAADRSTICSRLRSLSNDQSDDDDEKDGDDDDEKGGDDGDDVGDYNSTLSFNCNLRSIIV